jgi:sulfoxide reductase catalytic subunit YedY
VFFNRRRFMTGAAIGGALAIAGCDAGADTSAAATGTDPSAGLYPVKRNETYKLDREITPEDWATQYNNYYEFGSAKRIAEYAQALPIRPWTLTIDGLVEKHQTIAIDDLLARMPLEERLYRHRCVEAWAMAVPWSGFPLRALVEMAAPLSGAKYLRFETFFDTEVSSDQKSSWYPWPYVEGLTIEEARMISLSWLPACTASPCPSRTGRPCAWRCPGSTASSRPRAWSRSPSPTSAPSASGRRSRPASTASGPTSIRKSRTRGGASRANACSVPRRGARPFSGGYGEFVAGLYAGLRFSLFM